MMSCVRCVEWGLKLSKSTVASAVTANKYDIQIR